ncbi:MAG: PAS domain-containing protein [Enhygromyxa sp.]
MRSEARHESAANSSETRPAGESFDCCHVLQTIAGYAIVVDSRRRVRWMNRAPVGRSLRSYIGADVLQFIAEDQHPIGRDAIEQVLAGASAIELEVQGAESGRWHSLRIIRLSPADPGSGLLLHAIDIDDAKRAQTELSIERARRWAHRGADERAGEDERAAARRFALMADALPVLISYVDHQGYYRYNNAAYERWFGTSREEIYGRSVVEVLGEAAYRQIRTYVETALSGRTVRFESTVPYQDAGVRRVVARYVPDLTEEGEVAGFYALIEDVSAQREAETALREREEQLRQAQKLEALGRLASGIAHEFGNLLMTVVTGCTAIAEASPPNSAAATMVSRVKRAAQRGTSLTRRLLSFSRSSELPSGPLELDGLVGDLVVLLDRLLGSGIELEAELDAHAWIVADAGQIQQVLMNLALNARDAMPEGGRLRVSTELVDLDPDQARAHGLEPGAHVLLCVADTGIGMDAATRERIFDPFYTTKAPGQGTGLGLSTVYGIVRQAGGHIEVESSPGSGTVFQLYFPACEQGREA